MQDKLLISSRIKKTIEYVKKSTDNYPHEYIWLKNKIIDSYDILLRLSYRSNLFKKTDDMKEMLVEIKMIEYYIKISYSYKLISIKKFENIGKYMLEINKMINSWVMNETSRQSVQQDS